MTMKTLLLSLAALVIIGGGAYLIMSNPSDYTVTIEEQIAELETDLAEVDKAVAAGTLNAEQAVAAKTSISSRLAAINSSIATQQDANLSDSQRTALVAGLNRMKEILEKYQNTFVVIDATTPDNDKPLTEIAAEVVSDLEVHTEEVVPEYVAPEVDDTTMEENTVGTEETSSDETASSSIDLNTEIETETGVQTEETEPEASTANGVEGEMN